MSCAEGENNCGNLSDHTNYLNPHTERRSREAIFTDIDRKRLRKTSISIPFFPRTLRLWISVPADIVESKSLVTFQSELLSYLVNNC